MPSMNISLELFRIFCSVVEHGSLSSAARALYITQPAVSQSMRALEDDLGTVLLDRNPRGVTLTPDGEMLYGYARQAIGLLNVAQKQLRDMKSQLSHELRIGASDTLCRAFLLRALEVFHSEYPDVRLSVKNRTSQESIALLLSGEVDIAYVNLPMQYSGIEVTPVMGVHDVFIAGSRFDHLRGRILSLSEVAALPMVMLEKESSSRLYVDGFFSAHGNQLQPEIELGSHDLMPLFARIGLGVAAITREFIDKEALGDDLFELMLDQPVPAREIGMCHLKGVPATIAAKAFVDVVARTMPPA